MRKYRQVDETDLAILFHEVYSLYPPEEYAHFDLEDAVEELFGKQ